ncbi:hypothetical protein LTR37_009278 [Vermiconidia calcicola]|uniref:Uncharacterized protein n=1 Tax=Vermiconidia calcicola TaxID=1690605 RepID=A0ACC3N8E9_9PEZI|nr:hypothetical protein LTR37_009278 [Vermiconidia calcicola]
MEHAIAAAIESYHELNAAVVDELKEDPSPLEFMRYVARNRPFVVRRAAAEWDAVKKWDAVYLRQVMGNSPVNVAVTPLGNADAVVEQENGILIFVEPYERSEPFVDFLDYVQQEGEHSLSHERPRLVKYAQTQNDNLREEYQELFADVLKDIPFARIALEKEADAINMWIGNERSVTALHKDNYENIYIQVRGEKHFVLLSPMEMPCVNEQALCEAHYRPSKSHELRPHDELVIQCSTDELLPVPTWDPDNRDFRATRYSHLARPLRVTLKKGDMLYLPAMSVLRNPDI